MSHQSFAARRVRGFTLIELLVVIAIIGILASILFPVFARARENARRTACLSNMKQVGLGLQQYTQDYDEKLPPANDYIKNFNDASVVNSAPISTGGEGPGPNFLGSILPYTKSTQVTACPSALPISKYYPTLAVRDPTPGNDTNYFGNAVVLGRNMAVITNPSEIVYLQETAARQSIAFLRPHRAPHSVYAITCTGTTQAAPYYAQFANYDTNVGGYAYSELHFDGGNLVYADGHAKWKRGDQVVALDFGLVPATSNTASARRSTLAANNKACMADIF